MKNDPLIDDPVLDEIHATRERLLAECGGDLQELLHRAQSNTCKSSHALVPAPLIAAPVLITDPIVDPSTSRS